MKDYSGCEDQLVLSDEGKEFFSDILGREVEYLPARHISHYNMSPENVAQPDNEEHRLDEETIAYSLDMDQLSDEDREKLRNALMQRFGYSEEEWERTNEQMNGVVPVREKYVSMVGTENPMKYIDQPM
jgi:hypothetical protein